MSSLQIPKSGGEVDAACNKCKLTLAHTILAVVGTKIARVKCNTCGSDHMYRGPQLVASANSFAKQRRPRATAAEKVVIGFAQRLEGRDAANARTYSPKHTYTVDELVNHPTFGVGIVTAVRLDKVEIHFKADEKTLVHGRGEGAQAARPSFQAMRANPAAPARAIEEPSAAAAEPEEPAR